MASLGHLLLDCLLIHQMLNWFFFLHLSISCECFNSLSFISLAPTKMVTSCENFPKNILRLLTSTNDKHQKPFTSQNILSQPICVLYVGGTNKFVAPDSTITFQRLLIPPEAVKETTTKRMAQFTNKFSALNCNKMDN